MGMKNAGAKFQGPSLINGVDIWIFVHKNDEDTLFPSNDLVLVYDPILSIDSA